jgi:hypothetical protein
VLLAVVALIPWGGTPAFATTAAKGDWSVTIASVGNDFVTQGHDFFFDSTNASLDASIEPIGYAQVYVHESNAVSFDLLFGADPGKDLHTGYYSHAASYDPTSAPEPYISFAGEGRGVNTSGRFRVRQISTDADGKLTSLWVTFEIDGDVLGDIRFNVPPSGAVVGPRDVLWPDSEIDTPAPVASIAVWNPSSHPVRFRRAAITGTNATDDTIVSNHCSGSTLGPGHLCHIKVRFQPLAVGESTATLDLPESGGPTHKVSLEGFVRGTTTDFSLQSDPGDALGKGQSYDFVPANSSFGPQPSDDPHRIIQVDFGGGDSKTNWVVTFDADDGQLTPGTTYTAGQGDTAGMQVIGPGDCLGGTGTFTINDLEIDQWNDIVSFAIDFVAYCGAGPPSVDSPGLHGSLDYHADSVAISHTKRTLIVSGQVAGGKLSQRVGVQVLRGSNRIAHRTLELERRGVYVLELPRPKHGGCSASAKLPATATSVATTVSKTGRC